MADCASCGEPITDTALICRREADRSARRLREAADLWPELTTSLARLGRSGPPTPRAGHPAPAEPIRPDSGRLRHYADQVAGFPGGLPVDLSVSATMDAVTSTVTTWARHVAAETGADLPATVPEALRWLADRLDWLRYRPEAAEALDELGEVPVLVWRAVDRATVERRYLGPCDVEVPDGGHCEGELYGRAGADVVTCPACGIEHQVAERRRWLDGLVADWCYTAAEIEDAYPHIRADRIRQWAARGRITQHGRDRLGRGLYRLGDVLNLAQKRAA